MHRGIGLACAALLLATSVVSEAATQPATVVRSSNGTLTARYVQTHLGQTTTIRDEETGLIVCGQPTVVTHCMEWAVGYSLTGNGLEVVKL
jgi:hypothetical protein